MIRSDIIVTTPKNQMATAAEEARQCIEAGGGYYFRTFRQRPVYLKVGSRIFYAENGAVRGFATVAEIKRGDMTCGTTGRDWGEGFHAIMPADSWKWIKPIPMKGFQGWRYYSSEKIEIVGDWLRPRPK